MAALRLGVEMMLPAGSGPLGQVAARECPPQSVLRVNLQGILHRNS